MRRSPLISWVVAVLAALAVVGVIPVAAGQAGQSSRVQAQPIFTDDPAQAAPASPLSVVPVGAKLDVRVAVALDSDTAKVDQRFEAATISDYSGTDGRVLVPAVTGVRGFVSSLRAASPANRTGSLTLSFSDMTIGNRSMRLRASVEQVLRGATAEDATRLGADMAVGAAMSRVPGAGLPLLVGVRVGAGGTIESTEASDVRLPAGTILRIRIDQAIQLPDAR